MRYSHLGQTGLKISRIVLGSTMFGEIMDDAAVKPVIHRALDLGINTFDTGDIYAEGRAEETLGRLTQGERHRIVLCTKVGNRVGDGPAEHYQTVTGTHDLNARWKQGITPNDYGLSRKHIMYAVEASLRRLNTDYIDVYQLHRFDNDTPVDETLRALDDLVRSGKVRYVGASSFAAWQLYQSLWRSDKHGLPRFESMQVQYNLLQRGAELDILPACQRESVGVIAFSALAGGMLSGLHNTGALPGSVMAVRPGYQQRYMTPESIRKIERFVDLGKTIGRTAVRMAVDAVLGHPSVIATTVGVQRVEEFDDLVAAVDDPMPQDQRQQVLDIFG